MKTEILFYVGTTLIVLGLLLVLIAYTRLEDRKNLLENMYSGGGGIGASVTITPNPPKTP
jgi:hypothetical protein